jgi:hypothetical protein
VFAGHAESPEYELGTSRGSGQICGTGTILTR